MTAIATPCVQVCQLDSETLLCRGCGRTPAEIGRWLSYTPEQRAALMAVLPARLAGLKAKDEAAQPSGR